MIGPNKSCFLFFFLFSYSLCCQTDTSVINTLNAQSRELLSEGHNEKGFALALKAQILARKASFPEGNINSLYNISEYYIIREKYPEAISYAQKALILSGRINDPVLIETGYNKLSRIHSNLGDFTKALSYDFKSLKLCERLNDKDGMARTFNNIAAGYSSLKNNYKALDYYSRALQIYTEINDEEGLALIEGNMGLEYSELDDYSKAYELCKKSLEYFQKIKNRSQTLWGLSNMSAILIDQSETVEDSWSKDSLLSKAWQFAIQEKALTEKMDNSWTATFAYNHLALIKYYQEDYSSALTYALEELKLAKALNAIEQIAEAEFMLYQIYEKKKEPKLALAHYLRYDNATDSIFNTENTEKQVRLETGYEFEKKEAIKKAEHDHQLFLFQAEKRNREIWLLFLVMIICLVLISLFFMQRAYTTKRKYAEVLSADSERKELLLQEVHHRINNNLQIISSLLTLQANSEDDVRLNEYLSQSQSRIQSLSVLHELLYQNDAQLQINIRDYINKVLDFHKNLIDPQKGLEIGCDIADVTFPARLAVPIALIINELVTNSIKYAFEDNGKIMVRLFAGELNEQWVLNVSDNGRGMPKQGEGRKNSLGLRLITMMVKQIKGELSVRNLNGTVVEIKFNSLEK